MDFFQGRKWSNLFLFISAAIAEGRILDRAGLLKLQNLPSIDVLRGELCSILQMSAQKTLRLLQSNQQNLSVNLSQYVKDQTDKSEGQWLFAINFSNKINRVSND